MVWYGYGMACGTVTLRHMVWPGTIWYSIYGTVTLWYGMVLYGIACFAMLWYGTVRYCTVPCGAVWCGYSIV